MDLESLSLSHRLLRTVTFRTYATSAHHRPRGRGGGRVRVGRPVSAGCELPDRPADRVGPRRDVLHGASGRQHLARNCRRCDGIRRGSGPQGGTGAQVTADIAVTPGSTVYVEVGVGVVAPVAHGTAGGGASDIRTCAAAACSLTNNDTRLVVAGGGGGAGGGGTAVTVEPAATEVLEPSSAVNLARAERMARRCRWWWWCDLRRRRRWRRGRCRGITWGTRERRRPRNREQRRWRGRRRRLLRRRRRRQLVRKRGGGGGGGGSSYGPPDRVWARQWNPLADDHAARRDRQPRFAWLTYFLGRSALPDPERVTVTDHHQLGDGAAADLRPHLHWRRSAGFPGDI